MFSQLSDHKKGLLLTTLGGLALSMDIPLIRLSSGEVWSVLSARSLATIVVALAALSSSAGSQARCKAYCRAGLEFPSASSTG